MILLAHPTVNANWRNLALAIEEAGWLQEFHTALGWPESARWSCYLPDSLGREISRRSVAPVLGPKLRLHPWREIGRLVASRTQKKSLIRHETGPFSIDQVFHSVGRAAAGRTNKLFGLKAVIAGEDGALEVFRAARARGIRCIYELPIAYFETAQRLIAEEVARLPEWAPTLGGRKDSPVKLERKREELSLADLVLCPSSFVVDSLPKVARTECAALVPYGCETPRGLSNRAPENANGPLKVLFVGALSQRKGLADLFSAVARFSTRDVEMHVLGAPVVGMEFYRKQGVDFVYHPPCSQTEVASRMRCCDILLLPSLVEGRALVQLEALTNGLPLLVTSHAGGQDLVDEERTGFLIPIRSPNAIAERIEWFLSHRSQLPAMREACFAKAAAVSWTAYRAEIRKTIQERNIEISKTS